MDVYRLFDKRPPKEPLTTLPAVIRDWKWRFGEGAELEHMRDEIVDFCASAPDFRTAVDRACRSRRPNGKMHNHQSRVPLITLLAFRDRIIHHRRDVLKVLEAAGDNPHKDGFDAMHDYLKHDLAPPGIGPVTLYDVCTRIGGYLNVQPTSLYLHAGVREGWQALCRALAWDEPRHGQGRPLRVARHDLPRAFSGMPADEVEDFICTYRDVFYEMGER